MITQPPKHIMKMVQDTETKMAENRKIEKIIIRKNKKYEKQKNVFGEIWAYELKENTVFEYKNGELYADFEYSNPKRARFAIIGFLSHGETAIF